MLAGVSTSCSAEVRHEEGGSASHAQVAKTLQSRYKGRAFAAGERTKSDWPISASDLSSAKTSLFCCVDVVLSRVTCTRGSTCGSQPL